MFLVLVLVIAALHLCITLCLAAAFLKKEKLSNEEIKNHFSIIIAARNEEENLRKLIPSLIKQAYPHFEIIIALDRCNDGSKQFLEELTGKVNFIEIHEVPADWNPKKFALNKAVNSSKGDFLVFTDADCIPASENWLMRINRLIDNSTDIILGISPYKSNKTFLSQYASFEAFMTAFMYASFCMLGRPYMGVGRNLSIRKSFFQTSGGYQLIKSIKGGDDDLFIQQNASGKNTKMMIGRESVVYTFPKSNWKSYFIQKLRHYSVAGKYKSLDKMLLSIIHGSHLLFFISIPYLIFYDNFLWVVLFYLFIKLVSYRFAASKMGININYMVLPLVDMLYAVLTPVISLWSKLVKDIKWKN